MGILDGILGSLMGGQNNASPLGSILGSLLGGQTQSGQQQGGLGGLLGGSGLGGLLSKFQQGGLGEVAQSWVGTGPNKPVSPDQLQQVFGDQQVDQWAQQANMPKQDLLSQLSSYLPQAIDKMTPNGQVPADPVAGSAFDGPGVELGRKA